MLEGNNLRLGCSLQLKQIKGLCALGIVEYALCCVDRCQVECVLMRTLRHDSRINSFLQIRQRFMHPHTPIGRSSSTKRELKRKKWKKEVFLKIQMALDVRARRARLWAVRPNTMSWSRFSSLLLLPSEYAEIMVSDHAMGSRERYTLATNRNTNKKRIKRT